MKYLQFGEHFGGGKVGLLKFDLLLLQLDLHELHVRSPLLELVEPDDHPLALDVHLLLLREVEVLVRAQEREEGPRRLVHPPPHLDEVVGAGLDDHAMHHAHVGDKLLAHLRSGRCSPVW